MTKNLGSIIYNGQRDAICEAFDINPLDVTDEEVLDLLDSYIELTMYDEE